MSPLTLFTTTGTGAVTGRVALGVVLRAAAVDGSVGADAAGPAGDGVGPLTPAGSRSAGLHEVASALVSAATTTTRQRGTAPPLARAHLFYSMTIHGPRDVVMESKRYPGRAATTL
jgi:hypothetical protein